MTEAAAAQSPGAHCEQLVAPAGAPVWKPAPQVMQPPTVAWGAYWPVGHLTQEDRLANSPALQSSQKVRSGLESLPGGHSMQAVCLGWLLYRP